VIRLDEEDIFYQVIAMIGEIEPPTPDATLTVVRAVKFYLADLDPTCPKNSSRGYTRTRVAISTPNIAAIQDLDS
jgi:hypothetical protein